VAEWLAAVRIAPLLDDAIAVGMTVDELILRYRRFAERYYLRDGRRTHELEGIRDSLRPVRRLYGRSPASDFRPLPAQGRRPVDGGRGALQHDVQPSSRQDPPDVPVGRRVITRPPAVYQGLMAVAGLRRGREGVRETEPIRPVPIGDVEAVLPFLPALVAGMVRLQLLTELRPGETASMRSGEIDRFGDV
jgi:hypothetical protein